jgi:YVTN family beta-propeller protein
MPGSSDFLRICLAAGVLQAFATLPACAAANPPVPKIIAHTFMGNGVGASSVGINTTTGLVYVGNLVASTISVIDGTSNAVIATIPVADNAPSNGYLDGPSDVAVDEATNMVYVGMNNGAIAVVDGATNQQVGSFSLGLAEPVFNNNIAYNKNTGKLYYEALLPGGTSEIVVIDPKAQKVLSSIADSDATQIAVNQTTNTVYVTQYFEASLWVIDGAIDQLTNIVPDLGVPFEPEGCWLTNPFSCTSQGSEIDGVIVDETLNRVYTFGSQGGAVAIVDGNTNTVRKVLNIASNQFTGAVDPVSHAVYTISDVYGTLAVINGLTDKLVAYNILLEAGISNPNQIRMNPVNRKLYVPNNNDVVILQAK